MHRIPRADRTLLALTFVFAAALLGSGCAPAYPNCSGDEHCQARGEFCVDTKCAQCRVGSQCPGAETDACVTCVKGACGRKPDCCTSKLDCGSGRKCVANRCEAECRADSDCKSGESCVAGACTLAGVAAQSLGCATDADCGRGLRCEQGMCLDANGRCTTVPVQFDYDSYTLSSAGQTVVAASYKCLKDQTAAVMVEGHCDERGTDAYNMELGARRAKAVKQFLGTLAPRLKIKTMSYGKTQPVCQDESESCWYQNRRAAMRAEQK